MSIRNRYVDLRTVIKDYLKEQGITLQDLLSVMDENREGILEALRKQVHLTKAQAEALENALSSKDLNLLIFVIQTFYILNPSGIYKGRMIEPTRDDVMLGEKATFEGCKMILKALRISTKGLEA